MREQNVFGIKKSTLETTTNSTLKSNQIQVLVTYFHEQRSLHQHNHCYEHTHNRTHQTLLNSELISLILKRLSYVSIQKKTKPENKRYLHQIDSIHSQCYHNLESMILVHLHSRSQSSLYSILCIYRSLACYTYIYLFIFYFQKNVKPCQLQFMIGCTI